MTPDEFRALLQQFLGGNITGAARLRMIEQLHHFQRNIVMAQDGDAELAASGLIAHASWAAKKGAA